MDKEKERKDYEKYFGSTLEEVSKKPMKLYALLIEINKPKEKDTKKD